MRRAAVALPALFGLALLAASGPLAPAAASEAREALREGLALFGAGSYDESARRFDEAAARAQGEGLDGALARYDRGCALLAAGKAADAAAAFAVAAGTADSALAAQAHHNRGLALAAVARDAEAAGRLEGAVALLEQALGSFESAMRVDPGDEDPKANHELVARHKARLEQRLRGQGGGEPPPPERLQEPPRPQRPSPGREMQPDEARTMLDAMRQQETAQRSRVRPPQGGAVGVEKPW